MRYGRIMALDYGTKNVGLACSDESGILVRPLPSLSNRNRREFIKRLRSAIDEHEISELVIGIPLNMDGTEGELVKRVERFIAYLKEQVDIPLRKVDERLSTAEALELWHRMSRRQQQKYRTVDSVAAALILERFLKEP